MTELAPELAVSHWFNAKQPITLSQLRGKVVVIEAFQMLCPGCVSHGLPQAKVAYEQFPAAAVSVIGLHSVFEHHEAMTPVALEAFLHEYRIPFPVGVDERGNGTMPKTMTAYGMRGTPTLILVDRHGRQRAQYFGHVPDMRLGADIATLLYENTATEDHASAGTENDGRCLDGYCRAPQGSVGERIHDRRAQASSTKQKKHEGTHAAFML